jgi:putative hydrolase of the HAD superfamily
MIKVVLMDIGNVLVDFDIRKLLHGVLQGLGKPQHEVLLYLSHTGIAEKYEKGLITTAQLLEAVRKDLGYQGTDQAFGEAWNAIFTENAGGVAAFRALKEKKHRIVLASNTNELHFGYLEKAHPVIALADDAVLSHRVHARKPEPEFYKHCVAVAGVAPSEAVLIDDMPENVQGARAAGLHAIQFTGLEPLRASLKELGIEL